MADWNRTDLDAGLPPSPHSLILYAKPGCHLCEGLQEKLDLVAMSSDLRFTVEVRDITTQPEWMAAFEYAIPVLRYGLPDGREAPIARPSPRSTVVQLEQLLRRTFDTIDPSPAG
ncbi:MAG: glutaredoxin family protein [Oscillatoriales cyanobacterium]|nr:MAG: glutaredoxin family protein [Oscillatoriales cyanobacterium]